MEQTFSLKNRIREIRKSRGYTQERLARELGVSPVQVGYLERGKRRLSDYWMIRIAEVFDLHPLDLLEPKDGVQDRGFDQPLLEKTVLYVLRFCRKNEINPLEEVEMVSSLVGDVYIYYLEREEKPAEDADIERIVKMG